MHVGHARQPLHPLLQAGRRVHLQRAIGPEGRQDTWRLIGSPESRVMLETVRRIVGGVELPHVEATQDAARGQRPFAQLLVGLFPDARCRGRVEQLLNAEVPAQLQMRPVVERITQTLWNRCGPRQELLVCG